MADEDKKKSKAAKQERAGKSPQEAKGKEASAKPHKPAKSAKGEKADTAPKAASQTGGKPAEEQVANREPAAERVPPRLKVYFEDVVRKKLSDEFAPRQRDIQAAQTRLQQQQDRFQKDAPVMGEEERLNLERQIRDGQRDLQRTQNEYLEDLNARRNEEVGKLQRDVLLKVQDYASAQKFDLVLGDAIYVSKALDITDQVLAVLKGPGAPAAAPAAPKAPPPATKK